MSGGGWTLVLWGVYNAILASLLFIFPRANGLSFAMAYGMAAACIALGLGVVALTRRRRRARGLAAEYDMGTRLLPDLSYATTLLGLSIFGLVVSAAFGRWLALVCAGTALLALAGLVRERRAMAAERTGAGRRRGGSERDERGPTLPSEGAR